MSGEVSTEVPASLPSVVPRVQTNQEIRRPEEPWDSKNVLSLDGGGIRGYYSLLYLRVLMENVKNAEQIFISGDGIQTPAVSSFHPRREPLHVSHSTSDGNYLPCHYFDFICGTSTGGLIAIMLSRLRMTVADCIAEYLNLGGAVFGSPRLIHAMRVPLLTNRTKYDAEMLEAAIQQVIDHHEEPDSEKRFKSHAGSCQTFVCAFKQNSQQNMIANKLWVFRSYDQLRGRGDPQQTYPRNPGPASDYHIWEVARATSAAPLYFDPLKVSSVNGRRRTLSGLLTGKGKTRPPDATYIDGGLGPANNPACEIYEELRKSNRPIGTFVSIGTGRKTADRFRKGILSQIRAGFDALGDTEVAHTTIEQISKHSETGFSYFRFNEPESLSDMDFDEWKGAQGRETKARMDRAFTDWAIKPEVQDQFRSCAHQLVRRRRLRAALDPSRWECYALGSHFYCNLEDCSENGSKRWNRREEFEFHLRDVHGRGQEMVDDVAKERLVDSFLRGWNYPDPNRL